MEERARMDVVINANTVLLQSGKFMLDAEWAKLTVPQAARPAPGVLPSTPFSSPLHRDDSSPVASIPVGGADTAEIPLDVTPAATVEVCTAEDVTPAATVEVCALTPDPAEVVFPDPAEVVYPPPLHSHAAPENESVADWISRLMFEVQSAAAASAMVGHVVTTGMADADTGDDDELPDLASDSDRGSSDSDDDILERYHGADWLRARVRRRRLRNPVNHEELSDSDSTMPPLTEDGSSVEWPSSDDDDPGVCADDFELACV
jgi:hypothetical protein